MIYSASAVHSSLLEGMAAAGASISVRVQAEDGSTYNPVTELVRGFATAYADAVAAAEVTSVWLIPTRATYFPPTPWVVPPAPGASPSLSLSGPEAKALARANAASVGWTGKSAAVLYEGMYRGLILAATRTSVTLSSAALSGVPLATTLQFSPSPLSIPTLSSQMYAAWLANPKFGGGEPTRRLLLARQWASCAALAWDRTRPTLLAPGIPTGVLTLPYPLTLAPTL